VVGFVACAVGTSQNVKHQRQRATPVHNLDVFDAELRVCHLTTEDAAQGIHVVDHGVSPAAPVMQPHCWELIAAPEMRELQTRSDFLCLTRPSHSVFPGSEPPAVVMGGEPRSHIRRGHHGMIQTHTVCRHCYKGTHAFEQLGLVDGSFMT